MSEIIYHYGKPKFCRLCGAALNERDNRTTQYDEYTGEPVKVGSVILVCPNYNMIGDGHTYRAWNGDGMVHWKVQGTPRYDTTNQSLTAAVSKYRLEPLIVEEPW